MWHIAKRELYDNLNSLRFALTTVLLLGLMLTNAVVHLREQPARIQKYLTAVKDARDALEARADSLYELAQKGPGKLYKKPSDLHFCAQGGDPFLSGAVESQHYFWENGRPKSKKFLADAVSSCNSESDKYSSGRYENRLGVCDRLCVESDSTAVYLRCRCG